MRSTDIIKQIDIDRISDDLWCLVNILSPTGNERNAALKFAELLSNTGSMIDVKQDETIFDSPSVIGHLSDDLRTSCLQHEFAAAPTLIGTPPAPSAVSEKRSNHHRCGGNGQHLAPLPGPLAAAS